MINPKDVLDVQEWYRCDIPRKELKAIMKKSDAKGLIHVGGWLLQLFGTGYLAYCSLGTAWVIPAFLLYGVVYSACNAKWHECSHGTPFKTDWLNEFFYFTCGAMELRDPVEFTWSHARHHSYTMMTEVDPEIPTARPPKLFLILLDCFYLHMGFVGYKTLITNSLGKPTAEAREYVPESEYKKMFWGARAVLLTHLIALGLSIGFQSWLPVLFYGLPRFYGAFFQWTFILLQHAGLPENHWDHRESTRSLHVNPVLSHLFMRMENHIEHHLYPTVPFHALPTLRKMVERQLPKPYNGLMDGVKEMLPILLKQQKDPTLSRATRSQQPISEGEPI